ncbi:MAG: CHAT domain-containing protein, partial [Moorea sp. SIO3C2]|nr:CHAT domain-containing protein [Moorena sp. SIO3C2]
LDQFYQAMVSPHARFVRSNNAWIEVIPTERTINRQFKPLAITLYDWLIRPAEETGWLNESVDTLVFVMDGAFRRIPMAALYDQDSQQFLIEKYAIATTFGNLEIPQAPPSKQLNVLAAGLSQASVLSILGADNQSSTIRFNQLPHVETELDGLQATVQGSDVFLNAKFQKDTFQTQMASAAYNVVHLATHGIFGFTREDTFLIVPTAAKPDQNNSDPIPVETIDLNDFDSFLRPRKATPLELLVLSACQTATGDNREVLGIAGLAVQSGARSTLASLWNIEDASTAQLMADFYRAVPTMSKAKALQQAQVELIRQNRQPTVWAPYILVGDWR